MTELKISYADVEGDSYIELIYRGDKHVHFLIHERTLASCNEIKLSVKMPKEILDIFLSTVGKMQ